jgi:hypothetical protein
MEKVVIKYFTLMMFFFVIPLSIAQVQTLGTFAQNNDINLSQVCATCTYVNLQKVKFPDSSESYINSNMTKQGQTFYYTFSDTSQLGQYIVTTCGDLAGVLQCTNYDFHVTSNGETFSNSQPLALMPMAVLVLILFAIGFTFSKEKWKIKSFFYLTAVLATVVLINSTLIMFSTSTSLQLMGQTALILGIVVFSVYTLYILIFYTIEIFNKIREVKQKKREKSDPY